MEINQAFINSVLNYYQVPRTKAVDLFKRSQYRTDGVPILERQYKIGDVVQTNKINNKLNNDFFNEIINIKTGYFSGSPVSVTLPREKYSEEEYSTIMDAVRDWNVKNDIDALNAESVRFSSISGYSGRLLYINEDGGISALNIPGYECFFIGEDVNNYDYALRVYPTIEITEKGVEYKFHCDVYDSVFVYHFDGESIPYTLASSASVINYEWQLKEEPKEHMFNGIPLIRFRNNQDEKGDAEPVLHLIDAYDRVLSDLDNEIEQQRLAYMVFKGYRPNQEDVDAMLRTGAFGMDDPNAGIEFLTKNLAASPVFDTLKRLQDNILYFTSTPNMRDESFAGNVTGVALSYKIMPLETKCKTTEREFEKALRQQWALIASVWAVKNSLFVDYYDIDFIFSRSMPRNLLEESQVQMNLKGLVSEQTRLGLASFVKDPYTETKQIEEENENTVDLSAARNLMNQEKKANDLLDEETETTEEVAN